MNHQRILVVGAGGFLGSHFCDYFAQQNYIVAGVGRSANCLETSIKNRIQFFESMSLPDDQFATVLEDFAPQILIYAAGTASVTASLQSPYADFQQTVDACAFTLEMLRQHAPQCTMIFLSSAAVYGNSSITPTDELAGCNPVSPYAYHKRLCEILIEEYGRLYEINSSILRVFSAYGERLNRQVIHDTCQKIFNPEKQAIELFGTGYESRDFIHAQDVAFAIHCAIQSQRSDVYNLGSGRAIAISELAASLRDLAASEKPIQFNQQTRSGDPFKMLADISKLEKIGFYPKISLQTGLKNYLTWFLSSKEQS